MALSYAYTLPPSWHEASAEAHVMLRELTRALIPILTQLTGQIVVDRLTRVPELDRSSLFKRVA